MSDWTLTTHAREQIRLREVGAEELHAALINPQRTQPAPTRDGRELYIRDGVMAVVEPEKKVVITVLLNGASKDDWREFADRRRTKNPEEDKAVPPPRKKNSTNHKNTVAVPYGMRKKEDIPEFPVQTRLSNGASVLYCGDCGQAVEAGRQRWAHAQFSHDGKYPRDITWTAEPPTVRAVQLVSAPPKVEPHDNTSSTDTSSSNVLHNLIPTMHPLALELCGGDLSRITVLSWTRYEVTD